MNKYPDKCNVCGNDNLVFDYRNFGGYALFCHNGHENVLSERQAFKYYWENIRSNNKDE